MGLTESVNNFDTKLNQITTDIFKEVEKIMGSPLTAEKKKLSNLVTFLRSVSSVIAELEQSKKELEKTVRGFQEKGNALCSIVNRYTGYRFSSVVKPNDLDNLHTYIYTGSFMSEWATKNPETVWATAIYPNLQDGGNWKTKLNGKYVMRGGISFPNGERRVGIEATERALDTEGEFNYVHSKTIMTVE